MAPHLENKRLPRKANSSLTYFGEFEEGEGMQLLQRCSRSFVGDYYRNGTNAGAASGVSTSPVTGVGLRSSAGSKVLGTEPTGSLRSQTSLVVNTRSRVTQQQQLKTQQQQQQQQQQQRAPQQQQQQLPGQLRVLSLANGAVEPLRRSDEQLGPRSATGSAQDLCDNSNDSGLGFEERQLQLNKATAWNGGGAVAAAAAVAAGAAGTGEEETKKRRRMDIKLESEDANFAFPEMVQGSSPSETKLSTRNGIASSGVRGPSAPASGQQPQQQTGVNGSASRVVSGAAGSGRARPGQGLGGMLSKRAPAAQQGPVTLNSLLSSVSRNGKVQLQIICQPEQQHRARYQTEGSRGAVKDRTGNGFPIVRLVGYDKPATLQVFIGTDLGRVAPHMFYQACRVSGKNSTPCVERKIDGTIVIEVDMDPLKDMLVTCDCVGILKERNVDVEHRFPQEAGVLQGRSKKKSTRCRMVFRTVISHDDGSSETLQVCSQPIVCTQPPGIPEICKKSLTSCPCTGGLELFILGKNFLKDTRVVFQLDGEDLGSSLEPHWECTVVPDKEFLQQTHLVCVVPAYRRQDLGLTETISIKLYALSSGKTSEPHSFLYTAASAPPAASLGKLEGAAAAAGAAAASGNEAVLASKLPGPSGKALGVPGPVTSNALLPAAVASASFLGPIQGAPGAAASGPAVSPGEVLKPEPSPPPASAPVTPVMLWSSQGAPVGQAGPADVMMPPPNMVGNSLMTRRSSSSLQLILPDNLKTEVLDENSESSLLSESSLSGLPGSAAAGSALEQLVNENSREASQAGMIRNGSPVQDALLGVVDLMRSQHTMGMVGQQSPFAGMQESAQDANFVRASIIATSQQQQQQQSNMLTAGSATVPLDNLVNSAVESHQIVSPLRANNTSPNSIMNHVTNEALSSPQQTTSPSIPVKTMLLEALMPTSSVSPLSVESNSSAVSNVSVQVAKSSPEDKLMQSINTALLPSMQETTIATAVTAVAGVNPAVNVTAQNTLQVSNEVMPNVANAMLAQDPVSIQQQVQQVEQVVAHAQQQVEQVVAQAQQQAVQAVQQAQQQVVQQVVQHAQVVQQAVQQVQAVHQAPTAPAVQQAVQQATQEVVQQAVQQATQEVVQQVQTVQLAVQQAQAAQAMQQAVQQDIGSMLNQPAGFVAEASSALASGASQEPSQQRLTNEAEKAINNVITNATQDIINNKPITTTTAHAIIATKNILNSVATQSAQLMNTAMEGILPKSPANQPTIAEQVASKSPPMGTMPMQTANGTVVNQQTSMQQAEQQQQQQQRVVQQQVQQVVQQQVQQANAVIRKSDANPNGMMSQELMSDHELLNYINSSCFVDPQNGFLM